MKKDIIALIGGILLIGFSRIDQGWSSFWLSAGILVIVWALATFMLSVLKK